MTFGWQARKITVSKCSENYHVSRRSGHCQHCAGLKAIADRTRTSIQYTGAGTWCHTSVDRDLQTSPTPLNLRRRARPCQGTYLTAMTHCDDVWSCGSVWFGGSWCSVQDRWEMGRPEHLLPIGLAPDESSFAKEYRINLLRGYHSFTALLHTLSGFWSLTRWYCLFHYHQSHPQVRAFARIPVQRFPFLQPKMWRLPKEELSVTCYPLSIAVENRLGHRLNEQTVMFWMRVIQ